MCSTRSGIILTYTLSYRCPTGLSLGSYPFLMLHIPNQFHCKHIWHQHTTVCWQYTIIRIAHSNRYACMTVTTFCALHSWFCHNGLALNSTTGKSESILIGTQHLRTLPPIASLIIAGTPIPFSDTIKTLTLDQNLTTLNKHVSLLSHSIHFYIRALHHIRPALMESMAASLGACMECQHLTCTNYSLSKILSLMWFCLLFTIFQQVSHSVTSTGFSFTTEYSSKSPHLPISLQSPSSIPPIMSSPFFSPTASPCTIYVYWFWSACVQLQLSCNMELHSYLH